MCAPSGHFGVGLDQAGSLKAQRAKEPLKTGQKRSPIVALLQRPKRLKVLLELYCRLWRTWRVSNC